MKTLSAIKDLPVAGLFGGLVFWYGVHDIGFYLSAFNCSHRWVLPLLHLLALAGAVASGWISYRIWRDVPFDSAKETTAWSSGVSVAAAAIFSFVIFLQGIATLIYTGCER